MTARRADFRHLERLRVRWAEVDMQQIVFNGHYLLYADTAVAGYWRALALPYHETMAQLAGDLYVRKATLDYVGSARWDDVCDVGVRCLRIGSSSLTFAAAVFRGSALLVGIELVYVFADPATQTSCPVPAPLRDVLDAYEAGEPMLELRSERGDGGLRMRAINRLGREVAAGGWTLAGAGRARLDALQVQPALRRGGIGRSLLQGLAAAAQADGVERIDIDCDPGEAGFYRAAGFTGDAPSLTLTLSKTSS